MGYLCDKSFAIINCKTWEETIAMENMFSAVEQMIIELVPQYVEKYLNENKDKIIFEIETLINGKIINSNNIVNAIHDEIVKQLRI